MATADVLSEAGGVVTRPSGATFEDTLSRLVAAIEDQGLRVFDVIDHEAAAFDVGLDLRPTRVVIFGSPLAGTPLMVDHPLLALELPLRVLVWEGDDHQVWLSYLEPRALADRFSVSPDLAGPLAGPSMIIERAALA
jgi:uncharacterized protein (DUF302 family)